MKYCNCQRSASHWFLNTFIASVILHRASNPHIDLLLTPVRYSEWLMKFWMPTDMPEVCWQVCFDGETTAVYHAMGLKSAAIIQIPRLLPCFYSFYMKDKKKVLRHNILSSRMAHEVRCLRLGSPPSILIGILCSTVQLFQNKIRWNK